MFYKEELVSLQARLSRNRVLMFFLNKKNICQNDFWQSVLFISHKGQMRLKPE